MKPLYVIWGKVQRGVGRGRLLNFPTANIALHKVIPEGIYVSQVRIKDKLYPAAVFIGAAKTFGEEQVKAEAFILEYNGNLYGKFITLLLFKKIRGNQKFSSEKELVEQMEKDVLAVREYFKTQMSNLKSQSHN